MKKKLLESENNIRVLKLKQKDLMDAQKKTKASTLKPIGKQQCMECKNKDKLKQELIDQLNKAERETLEVKNEKMAIQLEQRDIEDRLRDLERDFHDKEMQLKLNSANELRDLTNNH